MSNEDLREMLAAMEQFRIEVASSPEKAKEFLVKYGFITPDGELTEPYR